MNIKNKNVLVTGGSGFLGTALVKRLLEDGNRVRVLSRDEGQLIELEQKFPHANLEIYTGDIADEFTVAQAVQRMDGVFHLAAFKHVGLAEKFTTECTQSNIIGSLNILAASLQYHLDFVVGISTDKAAQVAGVYGATKLIMEKMFKQYENVNERCQYRIVRYGNVLYSTGSVLCKWKKLLSEDRQCTITEPDATRFYWNVEQAIDLIYDCCDEATDSTPFCPTMKAMRIGDLFDAMSQKYGTKPIAPKIIGLGLGENLHEKVLDEGPYSNEVTLYTIEEIMEMV